jgi:hypothetical protein
VSYSFDDQTSPKGLAPFHEHKCEQAEEEREIEEPEKELPRVTVHTPSLRYSTRQIAPLDGDYARNGVKDRPQ